MNKKSVCRLGVAALAAALIFCSVLGCFCDRVSLDDIQKMEGQLEEIRGKIEESEKALADIKNQQSFTQSAISYSLSLIEDYTQYCFGIMEVISRYDGEISAIKEEIHKRQAEFDSLYPRYLSCLGYMREDGRVSIIEIIINAKDISQLIDSVERANLIVKHNNSLLDDINGKKQMLEREMASLEELKADRQKKIADCEAIKEGVAARIDELRQYLVSLDQSYKDKEGEKSLYEQMEKEADRVVKELIDAYNKQNASTPSYGYGEEMIWPLDAKWSYVSSKFGYRTHPITGEPYSFHGAIDIPASGGENIYAAHSGVVVTAAYHFSYGNYILLDHGVVANSGKRLYTLYAHCSELYVEEGQKLSQGEAIAAVGDTGSAKGEHLHFEVRLDDERVDPLKYVDRP